jgi:hypothetical protein
MTVSGTLIADRCPQIRTSIKHSAKCRLCGFDCPASAYEITDAVSQAAARRVTANTVSRILDLFVASNIAAWVESNNSYIASAQPDCRHEGAVSLTLRVCASGEGWDKLSAVRA